MRIDRCICEGVTFDALKKVAVEHGCRSALELKAHARFATGCGLCLPYVREMLRSGKTTFDAIIEEGNES